MLRLAAFCEAADDFYVASRLVERVVEGRVDWVRDIFETNPEAVREWVGDTHEPFFRTHNVYKLLSAYGGRLPHANFRSSDRGRLREELFAANMFRVARLLAQRRGSIDGVVVTHDMDNVFERREAFARARDDAMAWGLFGAAIGLADLCAEAWMLSGFEAADEDEEAALAAVTQDVGFSPIVCAQRLNSNHEGAKRNPKRVVTLLMGEHKERWRRCIDEAPLERLSSNGADNGLASFIAEVETYIVPLFHRPPT